MAKAAIITDELAFSAARVGMVAAIAAAKLAGRGDEKAADQAAVDAMRTALNAMSMKGRIVIGEGERDEAPMLYIGEEVGNGQGPELDIALDPLEGTTLTAKAMANALAVIAFARRAGACCTRPIHTWTSWRLGQALPPIWSISTRRRTKTPDVWPKQKA